MGLPFTPAERWWPTAAWLNVVASPIRLTVDGRPNDRLDGFNMMDDAVSPDARDRHSVKCYYCEAETPFYECFQRPSV